MKNIRNYALAGMIASFLLAVFTSLAFASTLESGIPFHLSLNSMTYSNFKIVVPDRGTKLTVSITNGSGNLDLYLKAFVKVSGGNVGELNDDANFLSNGSGANESISITKASTPALHAGIWYVAVLNRNPSKTSCTITADINISSEDFSYSIRQPNSAYAAWYVESETNVQLRTEGDFTYLCPSSGGTELGSSSPGVMVYHFNFVEPIVETRLYLRTDTFHWAYSQGHNYVHVSANGNDWTKLVEAPPPDYGKWKAGNFSGPLPNSFVGKRDIYIRISLYSYGKSASKGGVYCNTAQYLRWSKKDNNLTFKLDVKTATAPVENVLPLPTSKINYPAYTGIISPQTGVDPAKCKPIGLGNVANGGETVGVEIKLKKPSGLYDAYLALQAPAIDPNEFFMLGQDGIFHPFSQSGLVKWKQSETGKINEKPFGDFPVSLLPGGTYNLNFMLTAAGSREVYYLWQTSFSVPVNPDIPPVTVPDGSAGFFDGTLFVPNATILSGGQIYENSAPVPENELTAIKKDGKIYLYHPAMAQAKLSEDNSRLAVAYFMTGLSTSEINAINKQIRGGSLQSSAEEMIRSASPQGLPLPTLNAAGDGISLDTGLDLTLLSVDGVIDANNNRKRFAMVKTGDSNKNKYLLLPAGSAIPTELLECFTYGNSGGESRSDIHAFDKIETFGAFVRLSRGALIGFFSENQQKALDKDKSLVFALNRIDISYYILEGIRQVTGLVVPSTCASVAINGIARIVETGLTYLLTGDQHAVWSLEESALQGVCSNMVECSIQVGAAVTTGVGALAIEAAYKFISFVAVAQWALEGRFEEQLTAYYGQTDAYDVAMLGIKDMLAYTHFDKSSMVFSEIVWDVGEEASWSGLTTTASSHWPLAITPGGVILSYWESEEGDKIITINNWGTGARTDIGTACNINTNSLESNSVAITNAGRLFFRAETCKKEASRYGTRTVCTQGIYTAMANGTSFSFIPVVLDETEYNTLGHDNINIESLSVSRNGEVLVFSTFENYEHRLYAVDPSGQNPQLLAISDGEINSIHLSSSGDKILFDYTPPGASQSVPCVVSPDGTNMVQLSTLPSGDAYVDAESAAISPGGTWIAYGKGVINENPQMGIAFIRSDGSEYHFVNTGQGAYPIPSNPITFLANGNSIIYSGASLAATSRQMDLFVLNVDKNLPHLRKLTDTPLADEFHPVVLQ